MANIKLGICPIGWTNDDMPDLGKENTFQQCVSEMALAGFKGCEMGGKFPKDVDELKKLFLCVASVLQVHGSALSLQLNRMKKQQKLLKLIATFYMLWVQKLSLFPNRATVFRDSLLLLYLPVNRTTLTNSGRKWLKALISSVNSLLKKA